MPNVSDLPKSACIVWPFYDAPLELQIMVGGGDEDYVVASQEEIPYALERLGCCSNVEFRVLEDGRWLGENYRAPAWAGWHFIVSTHS